MSKKSCGDCIHYDSALSYCRRAKTYLYALFGQKECPVTDKPQTVFHEITSSPEVLAPHFVYHIDYGEAGGGYASTIVRGLWWHTEPEAIAATVLRLNSVKMNLIKR